jgi:hypothetical protein
MSDNPYGLNRTLTDLLRHHVSGAIERGEAQPITAIEYFSVDGFNITVGAKFWDNNLRVVQVTKVADWHEDYRGTGETQTWHDTTGGHADTLSGGLRPYGRLVRWFEGKDAEAYEAGTSYNDTKEANADGDRYDETDVSGIFPDVK